MSRPRLRTTVDMLFATRHRAYEVMRELPPLRFLGGAFDPALASPDPALVTAVLDRAAEHKKHHVRLTLVWFALRALMGAPFTEPKFRDFLEYWSRAFGTWIGAGAWYGLHGHLHMGCLAALGSLADIRIRLRTISDPGQDIPHGPLASEYYSIARLAGRSDALLGLALDHIEAALYVTRADGMNETGIRASILRELGRLDAALRDYRKVEEARRERGGTVHGEALSELGYAMLLAGDSKGGVPLMERGLDLLRAGPASGFQIRAMRKLALGYARRGRLSGALDLAIEAHDLAVATGACDQIRSLERLAKNLDRARIWQR